MMSSKFTNEVMAATVIAVAKMFPDNPDARPPTSQALFTDCFKAVVTVRDALSEKLMWPAAPRVTRLRADKN